MRKALTFKLLFTCVITLFMYNSYKQSFITKNVTYTNRAFTSIDSIQARLQAVSLPEFVAPKLFEKVVFNNVEQVEKKEVQIVDKVVVKKAAVKKEIIKTVIVEKKYIEKEEIQKGFEVRLRKFSKGPKIAKTDWASFFGNKHNVNTQKEIVEKPIQINLAKIEEERKSLKRVATLNTIITNENNNRRTKEIVEKISNETVDRISTALAANEKSERVSKKKSELKVSDQKVTEAPELVFYDYSEANENLDPKKTTDKTVTKTQQIVSTQEQQPAKSSKKKENKEKKVENKFPTIPVVADVKTVKPPIEDSNSMISEDDIKKLFEDEEEEEQVNGCGKKSVSSQNFESEYTVRLEGITLNGQNKEDIFDYEIRFNDDIDDIRRSSGQGVVKIKELLNSDYAVRRGTVLTKGYYPLTMDFAFEDDALEPIIPVISKVSMDKLITGSGVTGIGGHVLVMLDNTTEDADLSIDTKYEKKVYLNKNFRVIDRAEDEYSYILLLGVTPGNTILTYRTYKNEFVSKIIHITSDEIYFDANFYADFNADEFELCEDHLLGKKQSRLEIEASQIGNMYFDSAIKKLSPNRIKLEKSIYSLGSRKYLELKHLQESVFIGRWKNKYVDVPSESYMRYVLNQFEMRNVDNQCLIQVNINKPAKELYFNGQSNENAMRIQARILDKDGVFYKDLSEQSNRIFLLGEEQGIVNIKIVYADDSTDYVQSYCSSSTYLVEQL